MSQGSLNKAIYFGFYKQIADKLDQHIQYISETTPEEKNRWIWQLIQNSNDTPNSSGKLKIKIQLTKSEMKFMHNGNPFLEKNVIGLIQQVSTKQQSKQQSVNQQIQETGKYGTGFITTHMISKIIDVQGVFQYSIEQEIKKIKKFKITLDRNYKKIEELIGKVETNIQNLRNLSKGKGQPKENYELNKGFDTIFTYRNLDMLAIKSIYNGIEALKNNALFTFLFNPKIQSIQFLDKIQKKNFLITRGKQFNFQGLDYFEIVKIIDKQEEIYQYAAYTENRQYRSIIAIPIQYNQGLRILELHPSVSRVYKEFPLIGTQYWGYNHVMTCKYFNPNEKRSDLRLNEQIGRKNEKIEQNKQFLILLISEIETFYKKIAELAVTGRQFLAKCPKEFSTNQTKRDFFRRIHYIILNLRIIPTQVGYKNGNQIEFPIVIYSEGPQVKINKKSSRLLYSIYNPLLIYPLDLNIYQRLLNFYVYNIIQDAQTTGNLIGFRLLFNLVNKLHVEKIQGLKTKFGDQKSIKDYLNHVYEVICQLQHLILKNNNREMEPKIILNQNNELVNFSQLCIEQKINPTLKQISKKLGADIKNRLLNNNIKNIFGFVKFDTKKLQEQFQIKLVRNFSNDYLLILYQLISKFEQQDIVNDKFHNFRIEIYKVCSHIKFLSNVKYQLTDQSLKINYKEFITKFLQQITNRLNFMNNYNVNRFMSEFLNVESQQQVYEWICSFQVLLNKSKIFQLKIVSKLTLNFNQNKLYTTNLIQVSSKLTEEQIQLHNIYTNMKLARELRQMKNPYDIKTRLLHWKINQNIAIFQQQKINKLQLIDFFSPIIQGIFIDNKQLSKFKNPYQTKKFFKYLDRLLDDNPKNPIRQILEKRKIFQQLRQVTTQIYISLELDNTSKNAIYELIKNPKQLRKIIQLKQRYGSLENIQLK